MANPVKLLNSEKPAQHTSKKAGPTTGKLSFFRWLHRILLGVVALYVIFLAVLYCYLLRDPQSLVDEYFGELSAKTGLQFSIGSVEATLLPIPAIAVSNASIIGKYMDLRIAWCQLAPSLKRMFTGNFFPGSVVILRPRLNLKLPVKLADLPNLLARNPEEKKESGFTLPDMDMEIHDLVLNLAGADESSISLLGLEAMITASSSGEFMGISRFAEMTLIQKKEVIAKLERFIIDGTANILNLLSATPKLNIAGQVYLKDIIEKSDLTAQFSGDEAGMHLTCAVQGELQTLKESVSFSIKGAVAGSHPLSELECTNLAWELGSDSGSLSFNAFLNKPERKMEGEFRSNRLSLPAWLGFARNLPPGLQLAMDNITNARARFILTEKGLQVPYIKAYCTGALFTGSGGVPDWSKPSVNLNLSASSVNLGLAIPEALGETPEQPFFPYPAFTPMPGKPLEPGEAGIDYDINLKADNLNYGTLLIKQASLRIYPGKMDTTGLQDVLLDGSGTVAGGKVTGHCILGADPSLPYYIKASAKDINGQQFGKAMPMQPVRQGIYSASAIMTSRGKQLTKFLDNLKGDWQITGQNARLSAADIVFKNLKAEGKLRSGTWNHAQLGLEGSWKTSISHVDWDAGCDLNGKLVFSKNGLTWHNLSTALSGRTNNGSLPKGIEIKISGRSSGQTGDNQYKLEDGQASFAGLTARGSLSVNGSTSQIKGKFSSNIGNPEKALNQLGIAGVRLPQTLKPIIINTDFTVSPDQINLANIKSSFGKINLNGSCHWGLKSKRQNYVVNLTLDKIRLADFSAPGKSSHKWNFPFLTQFDASGALKIMEADIFDIRLLNAQTAFKLQAGKLDISSFSANFYGAPLAASGIVNFNNGLVFSANARANAFNLGSAARDHKPEVILKGVASVGAKLNASLSGEAKLMQVLNGEWNLRIDNGSWQSMKKSGEPDGKPTAFTKVSASGNIKSGVLNTNDFILSSQDLNVTGGGWYNLATNRMDCTFNINMKNVPNFPIYIYGPVTNLQKRIGAGKMIINAVGGVATGFVNAIGGALKGVWNIFSN